ncbi:MAG: hypothetical protein U0R50_03145 [Gaiellales bacterium]
MTTLPPVVLFDLDDTLLDDIGIEGEVGFGKPDPRAYERALAELSCDASEAWMVTTSAGMSRAPRRSGSTRSGSINTEWACLRAQPSFRIG